MSTNKSIEISHKGPFSQSSSAPLYFSATTRNIATPITPSNQKDVGRTPAPNTQKTLSPKN